MGQVQPGRVPSVALVGVHGHGRKHLAELAAGHRDGWLKLAALCDLRPIEPMRLSPAPADPAFFFDYRTLLAQVRPDVVVIATPPATHLAVALAAVQSGADVLVEKPPLLDSRECRELAAALDRTGRSCQVGFQSLGSAATGSLLTAVESGRLGQIRGVSAVGRWQRTREYYERSRWAGRRLVDGRPTGDGALTNPFAHALMSCLAVLAAAGLAGPPTRLDARLFHAWDIEVDDTSCLRAEFAGGTRMTVAVTLCADDPVPPRVIVHGTAGQAELSYTEDLLRFPGESWRAVPGRASLLANLVAHRRDPVGEPLLVPLERTDLFTELLSRITSTPVQTIPAAAVETHGRGPLQRLVVRNIDALVEKSARTLTAFDPPFDRAEVAPW